MSTLKNPKQSLNNAVNRQRLISWAMAATPEQVELLLAYLGLDVKK